MDYEAMGKRVRAYRNKRGLTQAMLAEMVGISTSFMGHIERGSRVASIETLANLSEALETTIDSLVSGREPAPTDAPGTRYKVRVLNDVLRVLSERSNEWLHEE
ncbi:hypothetical protein FACS1894196_0840 [Clostridia bacterium]|nr:hypothetical protein FACS1894196_0840 [Clostridia bacterium]